MKDEKEKLSGLIGTLSYEDRKALIYEVLLKTNYNLMVTPKEIDFIIDKNGRLTFKHPKVNIEGELYTLNINAEKE